jgi:tRNA (guanine37-N1)-methyltransferase
LGHEHERLVDQFEPGQVVADVMAGVGPFAVPAAKKRCLVLGNDLNPESTRWMEKNRVDNRVCVCGQHNGLTSADIYACFF